MEKEKLIKNVLIPLFIAISIFAVFYPSLRGEFLNWDDLGNTVENISYRGDWGSVFNWSFMSFYREHFMPVAWIVFALIYKIWGLNPFGYHLLSIIFHATTAIALYFLALNLIQSRFGALFAALFFALHPLRVEAVSWVSAWAYPICGLFIILSILTYIKYSEGGNRKFTWYVLSLFLFLLALLSKSIAVSLPIILLIMDLYPLNRRAYLEKIPYFVLSIIISLITIYSVKSEAFINPTLFQRPFVVLYSLSFYLEKTFLPINLMPVNEVRTALPKLWSAGFILRYIISGLFFTAAVLWRKKYPAFTAAYFIYLVSIIPISGILQPGPEIVGDRYSYFGAVGISLLTGLIFIDFRRAGWKIFSASAAIIILSVLAFLTFRQISVWKTSEEFWKYVVAQDPGSSIARNNLANTYLRKGDAASAIEQYKIAISLEPNDRNTYFNLANAFVKKGDYSSAIEYYSIVIKADPLFEPAYVNLGVTYVKMGDIPAALGHYENTLALYPDFSAVRDNLSKIKLGAGISD